MPLSPNELTDKLRGALDGDYNIIDEDVVVEVVGILERYPLTKEDLEVTRIGKCVNELRRRTANQELCRRAKNLVRSWQKLVSASSSPATASPRLPPRLPNAALPGPRISSPLVLATNSPAASQPRSPASACLRGAVTTMTISTSPLVRASASPALPTKGLSTPVTQPGSRPLSSATAALRVTSRLASPAGVQSEKAAAVVGPTCSIGKTVASPAVPSMGRTVAPPAVSSGRTVASPAVSSLGRAVASPAASTLGRTVASPVASTLGRAVASPSTLGRTVASPAASTLGRTVASPAVPSVGKTVASPAVHRQLAGNSAGSSPALRPPPVLPGGSVPASPRLPATANTSRLESTTTVSYSCSGTPPVSSGVRQINALKASASSSPNLRGPEAAKPMQKVDLAHRNGTASDGRPRVMPYIGAASVSPASSTHSTGTPVRPTGLHKAGGETPTSVAAPSKHSVRDRANGDATIESTAVSKTNAANRKRRRSDDSLGSSSTSSAPPRKLPTFNGDAGSATPGHPSVSSVKGTPGLERRPSKVKTTAQLIAELQASKGGDDLLKSETITRIFSNQIEREKFVEHESVVPASAKPRPRKKPGATSVFNKPPVTPDSASLAKTKSEMVQKYLNSSLLVSSGNGGEDSQMTCASSSPSTVGVPSVSVPDNAVNDEDEDEFVDIEGLDNASTPEVSRPSRIAITLKSNALTAARASDPTTVKAKASSAAADDPYALLPPLNLDEITWSDEDDQMNTGGHGGIAVAAGSAASSEDVERLHEEKWHGVNGVFSDGRTQWHDWTETIVHGNETGSTLFILPYVDVGD